MLARVLSCPYVQARIQRIIAERFLPLLDDVFVAHRTHILRTTAYAGGPACIAGVLGSKSVELGASGECVSACISSFSEVSADIQCSQFPLLLLLRP